MDWFVVKYSYRHKIKRPVHVFVGDEDSTIWTPSFGNATPFTYRQAMKIARIKSVDPLGNKFRLKVVNREELDRYALEWYLEEDKLV